MNTKQLVATFALLGSAFFNVQASAAGPAALETRDTVTAELLRARAAGEICGNEAECDRAPASAAPGARQQAFEQGRGVHVCYDEAECDAAPHRDFTVTREQVLAELYRARAAGEIAETEADNDIGRAALRHGTK